MVEAHLPLVRSIARRYAGRGEPFDDLVQVGSVGLVRASKHFDFRRGVAFATFAMPAIEGEIRRHLDERSGSVRVPRQAQRLSGELRRRRGELRASLGRPPTVPELAAAMGVEPDDVERALQAEQAQRPASPTQALDEGESDSRSMATVDDRLLLADSARVLNERERRIVFMRFHADMTETDIARELGISQAQVSKLLGRALEKLRKELNDQSSEPLAPGQGDSEENQLMSSTALPYRVTVTQDRDGVWVAALEELPSCRAGGATADEAVERLRAAMQGWLSAGVARRSQVELPKQDAPKRQGTSHSGRFLVRMPGALHQELSLAAERQHVSLNRFVIDALAAVVSGGATGASTRSEGSAVSPRHRKRLRMLVTANVVVTVLAAAVAVTLLVLAFQRGI